MDTTRATVPPERSAGGAGALAVLNSYFDKILVLTLRRASDRQERVRRVLAGVEYELFHGVDKHDLDPDDLLRRGIYDARRARALHRHGKAMTLGEIACALSFQEIYRRILEAGWRRVLVFEDDVDPVPEAIPALPAVLSQLPADWELVYLGYSKHEVVTPALRLKRAAYRVLSALRLMKWTPREVANLLPRPYSANLMMAGFHDCLHAYGITPSGARKLLAAQTPVALAADTAVSRLVMRGELAAFAAVPVLFGQAGGIGPQRTGPSYIDRSTEPRVEGASRG
jgi:glycosyl transferase family 25